MMNITTQILTYDDVIDDIIIDHDDYKIAAYCTNIRRCAFLANPNLVDVSQCFLYLKRVDDVIGGIAMLYETRMLVCGRVSSMQTGSALEVYEKFRHLALGVDIMMYTAMQTPYKYVLSAGISDLALPLYKKLKYNILAYPRMMFLRNSRCFIESKGIHGVLLDILSSISNFLLRIVSKIQNYYSKKIICKYNIKKESKIPIWVDDMVLHDGYKYMEVHDQKWLQWNLDYNFRGLKQDIQSFYSIYKGEKPIGFFMTKERFRESAGGLKNILIGSIVEWESINRGELSESDIIKMSISTFSRNVDIIEFATADTTTVSKMKKWGFIHHGDAHIAFKDKTKQCKDASDINLWRIRYGYADVILT